MTNKVNMKNSGNGLPASSWGNPHFAPPVITNVITNKVNNPTMGSRNGKETVTSWNNKSRDGTQVTSYSRGAKQ